MSESEVKRSVLVVSNGYGEDTIAAGIVEQLLATAHPPRVMAMPLVGEGRAYQRLGVEIVGPRRLMPSGGLILAGWTNIFTDIKAGFWKMTLDQIATLKRLRGQLGALVAVGDTVPVLMGGVFGKQRVIFVGTAKSNYFYAYSWFERMIFRRCCDMVFARDEATAATLRQHGIAAKWVGNAMMDSLGITPADLPVPADVTGVGLLPGSRKVAFRDLPVILEAARLLGQQRKTLFMMALADSTDVAEIAQTACGDGWSLQEDGALAAAVGDGYAGLLAGHGQRVLLMRGRFGDVIKHCSVIIGQAGTGNEQAVGMGKPVISFDSDGRKEPGWYRARQKGLLGDSMSIVERSGDAIAREVAAILDDRARYAAMQKAGYARMGPPGASAQIASYIMEHVERKARVGAAFTTLSPNAAEAPGS